MPTLISWNVNGLRACMNKGFMDFFKAREPDIFCVQETKMMRDQAAFDFAGYHEHWNSAIKKGYSGTAVFAKQEPLAVSYGLGIAEHDNEGRVITLEYPGFFLVNCYTPNSKQALERLSYRMLWEDAFRIHLLSLDALKPVIVCGDLNVAHKEIDIKNPKSNMHSAGFTPEERSKMTELLSSGFVDTFRFLYPDKTGAYTWWSYMGGARGKNIGWRIDYFLVSERLKDRISNASIFDGVWGSDHCPVGLEIEI
jgi:exodeoxyribonuclease-3